MAEDQSDSGRQMVGADARSGHASAINPAFANVIAGLSLKAAPPSLSRPIGPPPSLVGRNNDLPASALAALDKFKNFAMNPAQFEKMYAEGKIGPSSPESRYGSIAKRTGVYAKKAEIVEIIEQEDDALLDNQILEATDDCDDLIEAPTPNDILNHNKFDGFTPYA